MKTLITKTIYIFIALSLSACLPSNQKQGDRLNPNQVQKNLDTQSGDIDHSVPKIDIGGSTGGGGFVDKEKVKMLELAVNDLVSMLSASSNELFQNLPNSVTKDMIINTINDVKFLYNPDPYSDLRYGVPLKFDYNIEENTIYATKHFLIEYSAVRNVDKLSDKDFYNIKRDIQADILHELAHLLFDIGKTEESDHEARTFANNLLDSLGSDNLICLIKNDQFINYKANNDETIDEDVEPVEIDRDKTMAIIELNLPTGTVLSYDGHFGSSISYSMFPYGGTYLQDVNPFEDTNEYISERILFDSDFYYDFSVQNNPLDIFSDRDLTIPGFEKEAKGHLRVLPYNVDEPETYDYMNIDDVLFGSFYRANIWALKMNSENKKRKGLFTHTRFDLQQSNNKRWSYKGAKLDIHENNYEFNTEDNKDDSFYMVNHLEYNKVSTSKGNLNLQTKVFDKSNNKLVKTYSHKFNDCIKYQKPFKIKE